MAESLREGDHVMVVGGVWPERRGCKGVVVRAGIATTRVLLDDDPLAATSSAEDVVFDSDDVKFWRLKEHVLPPY